MFSKGKKQKVRNHVLVHDTRAICQSPLTGSLILGLSCAGRAACVLACEFQCLCECVCVSVCVVHAYVCVALVCAHMCVFTRGMYICFLVRVHYTLIVCPRCRLHWWKEFCVLLSSVSQNGSATHRNRIA